MEVKNSQFYSYDCNNSSGNLIVEEQKILKQLQEEAELYNNSEHTEDELTAAIGMMLMHYQVSAETQDTPKNKPINTAPDEYPTQPQSLTTATVNGVQKTHAEQSNNIRKSRKSNSNQSLLASCRNILKEFLSQNSL